MSWDSAHYRALLWRMSACVGEGLAATEELGLSRLRKQDGLSGHEKRRLVLALTVSILTPNLRLIVAVRTPDELEALQALCML